MNRQFSDSRLVSVLRVESSSPISPVIRRLVYRPPNVIHERLRRPRGMIARNNGAATIRRGRGRGTRHGSGNRRLRSLGPVQGADGDHHRQYQYRDAPECACQEGKIDGDFPRSFCFGFVSDVDFNFLTCEFENFFPQLTHSAFLVVINN